MKSINQKKYTLLIKEMAKAVIALGLFALLVIIIIGIALAVYFTTKKSEDTTQNTFVPEISNLSALKTVFPASDDKTQTSISGYIIEYSSGEIDNTELSKNVTIKINWDNKSGFDRVTKLNFKRYVDDKLKETIEKKSDNESDEIYFNNYETGLSVVFDNETTLGNFYNVIGKNKVVITAYYKDLDDNDKSIVLYDGSEIIEIKKDELTAAFELTEPITVEYKPSSLGFTLDAPTIKKNSYYVIPFGNRRDISKYIGDKVSGKYMFIPVNGSASKFYLKFINLVDNSEKWVKKGNDDILSYSDNIDDRIVITLSKSPIASQTKKFVRFIYTDTNGENKFLVFDYLQDPTVMIFRKLIDIPDKIVYSSMDILITETQPNSYETLWDDLVVCKTIKNKYENIHHFAGAGWGEHAEKRCFTTKDKTKCVSDNYFYTPDEQETWFDPNNVYTKGYKDMKYSEICELSNN